MGCTITSVVETRTKEGTWQAIKLQKYSYINKRYEHLGPWTQDYHAFTALAGVRDERLGIPRADSVMGVPPGASDLYLELLAPIASDAHSHGFITWIALSTYHKKHGTLDMGTFYRDLMQYLEVAGEDHLGTRVCFFFDN